MHGLPLALFLALQAAPAHSEVLRLDDVERRALGAHPQLQAQDARIRRARAQEELARSARRPNVAARVDGTLAPGGELVSINSLDNPPVSYLVSGSRTIDDPRAFVPQFRYSGGIAASATLYDFGRTGLQIDAAKAQVRAESSSVDQVRLKVVLDVRDAYAGWLRAGESARIADEQLARLQEWRSKIDQLIKEGARPSSDAALARYEEQRAQLVALRARSASDLARVTLEAAAQTDLPDDASADTALLEQNDQPVAARSDEQVASAALERQRQAALLGARALDRSHAPVLSGSAELGVRGQETDLFPAYRVSLGLTVPIWDGGEQSARAAMARADAEELSARLAQTRRAESDQQRLARTQAEQSEQALKLALQVQSSAQTLLDQAVERYQLGSGGIEPVLDAQHTLADAELDVLGARLARLQATLKLRPAPSGS